MGPAGLRISSQNQDSSNIFSSELFHSCARKRSGHKWGLGFGHVHDWKNGRPRNSRVAGYLVSFQRYVLVPIWTRSTTLTIPVLVLVLCYTEFERTYRSSTRPVHSTSLFKSSHRRLMLAWVILHCIPLILGLYGLTSQCKNGTL